MPLTLSLRYEEGLEYLLPSMCMVSRMGLITSGFASHLIWVGLFSMYMTTEENYTSKESCLQRSTSCCGVYPIHDVDLIHCLNRFYNCISLILTGCDTDQNHVYSRACFLCLAVTPNEGRKEAAEIAYKGLQCHKHTLYKNAPSLRKHFLHAHTLLCTSSHLQARTRGKHPNSFRSLLSKKNSGWLYRPEALHSSTAFSENTRTDAIIPS